MVPRVQYDMAPTAGSSFVSSYRLTRAILLSVIALGMTMAEAPQRPASAQGKLDAWYGEICLMDQKFVKDDSKTVRDVILAVNSRTGENISVARFARFVVGEGR